MIDIHAHIIPCGDDGSASREETLEMARAFSRSGVERVAATPHFIRGSCEIEPEKIISLTAAYNRLLEADNIPLTIVPGMEVEMCHEIPALLKAGKLLTLNHQEKYLLVELPFHSLPAFTQQIFYELKLMGITPVLAHPERNQELCAHPEPIGEMVHKGVLVQVNGGSLLGHFGNQVRKRAISLLENNLVHLIAGDAHQAEGERGPCLHLARPLLDKLVGKDKSDVLLHHNPRAVLEGESVIPWEPKQGRTGLAGLFNRILGK